MASEIFANFSGTSLIYLLWTAGSFLPYGLCILLCKVGLHSKVFSPLFYLVIQYLGMWLLFLIIKKKEDLELDFKEIILMIIFAPAMQMTFLASFIYYWSREDKGKMVEIIFMRVFF